MTSDFTPADEELLAEMLLEWEDAQKSSSPKTVEEICRERPELISVLNGRITELAEIDELISEGSAFKSAITRAFDGPPMSFERPEIPGYQILSQIGQGGMGVVYKAMQTRLNRFVAIKVIRGGRWVSTREVARFKGEAEILARLHHPGIVQIFDVLDCGGIVSLVLEYVDGKSLAETSRQTTTAPLKAADLILEICKTLIVVHAKGILHRDIKPGNVLVSTDGRVKLTDFGLAKETITSSDYSMTGDILGSPSYMAPEQASGNASQISARTDVYAVGATLYQLLTARPPFAGSTAMETLLQVKAQEPIPPRHLVKSIPKDLDTICLKCLEKEPERRYANAALLSDDLERFIQGIPILARPVSTFEYSVRWCRRNPDKSAFGFFAIVSMIALAVGMTWFSVRLADERKEARLKETALQAEKSRATTQEFYARYGRIRERGLSRPVGWISKNLAEIDEAAPLADSDDNHQMLRTEALRCFCSYDMRSVTTLLTGVTISCMSHHPQRPLLALAENHSVDDVSVNVYLIDMKTYQHLKPLVFPVSIEYAKTNIDGCRSIAFTPSGDKLLVGSRSGWVYVWDTSTWDLTDSWRAHTDWTIGMAIAADAKSVYTASRPGDICQWDLATHALLRETKVDGEVSGLGLTKNYLIVSAATGAVLDLMNFEPVRLPESWLKNGAAVAPMGGEEQYMIAIADRLLRIDLDPPRETCRFEDPHLRRAHKEYIRSLRAEPTGRFAVSTDYSSVKLWDCIAGTLAVSMNVGNGGGRAVTFLPGGNSFVISGREKVELWEIIRHPGWVVHPLDRGEMIDARIFPNGQLLAQISERPQNGAQKTGMLQTTNLMNQEIHRRTLPIDGNDEIFPSIFDGKLVVTDLKSRRLRFFELKTLAPLQEFTCGQDPSRLTMSNGVHPRLYFAANDVTATGVKKPPSALYQFDWADKLPELLWSNIDSQIQLNQSQILAIAANQQVIATSSLDGNVRLHNAETGAVVTKIPVTAFPTCLQFIRDTLLLTGDDRGVIRLLKIPEGILLDERFEHGEEISGFAINSDGNMFVSACTGGEVRFWQLDGSDTSLQLTAAIGPLSGPVKRLTISSDGKTLLILIAREAGTRILRLDFVSEGFDLLGLRKSNF